MKKIIITVLLILIFPMSINATTGWLREGTIKTCPNGVTYGKHGDKSADHWHKAIKKNGKYYSSGKEIKNDPCPTDNTTIQKQSNVISNDTSIKSITIDGEEIEVSDNMLFETKKNSINIKVNPNDLKSKVKVDNNKLLLGKNEIKINVTAENEETKEYVLIVNRSIGNSGGTATIRKFVVNNSEVNFYDNNATVLKYKDESSLDYSYELSPSDAELIIYINEEQVQKLEPVKNGDSIKLQVIDGNSDYNLYYLSVQDIGPLDFIIGLFATGLLIAGVVFFIKKRKAKNKG